jgi:hypothetical protein
MLHQTMAYASSVHEPRPSLAEMFVFSLIVFQALLISIRIQIFQSCKPIWHLSMILLFTLLFVKQLEIEPLQKNLGYLCLSISNSIQYMLLYTLSRINRLRVSHPYNFIILCHYYYYYYYYYSPPAPSARLLTLYYCIIITCLFFFFIFKYPI